MRNVAEFEPGEMDFWERIAVAVVARGGGPKEASSIACEMMKARRDTLMWGVVDDSWRGNRAKEAREELARRKEQDRMTEAIHESECARARAKDREVNGRHPMDIDGLELDSHSSCNLYREHRRERLGLPYDDASLGRGQETRQY